jgi:hypothetical protein
MAIINISNLGSIPRYLKKWCGVFCFREKGKGAREMVEARILGVVEPLPICRYEILAEQNAGVVNEIFIAY